jgi:hypothetical protein
MSGLDDFKGKITDDQFKELQKIVSDARKDGESKGSKKNSTETSSDFETSLDENKAKSFGEAVKNPLAEAGIAVKGIVDGLDPTNFEGADFLTKKGQELANAMGLGQSRMAEMKTTIADAIPEMLRLGISSSDAFKVLQDVPTSLGVNTTMSTEALREMGAAAEVSKINAGELAKEFKGVGISLYDVGNEMATVANYAKSVGVNVGAVSKSVVDNLYKMNLYNFDNGVKGLAKMAANAASMGVTMEHVQTVTDKVFNPEGAIEMAAGLQRLGVSSSALLDPLKAMDLSMNDPEQLQKEIGNIAKEFSSFNKETGKFEIMPGSKRRLMEVAKEMGIPAKELANMSIKASEFDMKMSKIKFPSLAASEEDKTLIANMSQMKGGEAFVQIKNEQTGKMDEINVSKLTAEQITKLKEQQSAESKTIEDIALDQLNVMDQINAKIKGGTAATTLGKATSPAMDRFYNAVNVVRTETVNAATNKERVNVGNTREKYGTVAGDIESAGIKTLQGDYSGAMIDMAKLAPDLIKIGKEIATGFGSAMVEGYGNIKQGLQTVYEPVTGVKPLADDDKSNQLYKDMEGILGNDFVEKVVKAFNLVSTKSEVSGEVKHSLTINGDGGKSIGDAEFNKKVLNAIVDPTIKSQFDKLYVAKNSGLGG